MVKGQNPHTGKSLNPGFSVLMNLIDVLSLLASVGMCGGPGKGPGPGPGPGPGGLDTSVLHASFIPCTMPSRH